MNCPSCGAGLTDGVSFCPSCGASVTLSYNQSQYQQTNAQPQYQQANSQIQHHQMNSQPQYQQINNQMQYQQMNGQPQYQQANNQPQYQQMSGNYNANVPKFRRKFNAGHFIVIIGSLLCLLGSFLPYITVSSFTISLFRGDGEGDGIIFLVTAIIIMVLAMLRLNILNILTTAIQGAFAIYEIMDTNEKLGYISSVVNYGIGYYFLLIGGIVAFIGAIMGLILHNQAKRAYKQSHPMM